MPNIRFAFRRNAPLTSGVYVAGFESNENGIDGNPVCSEAECGVAGCAVPFARDSGQAMKHHAAPRDMPAHVPTPRCSCCATLHGATHITPFTHLWRNIVILFTE